jgi:hypothetical protein
VYEWNFLKYVYKDIKNIKNKERKNILIWLQNDFNLIIILIIMIIIIIIFWKKIMTNKLDCK